jgi:hypothetical protein
MGHGGRKKVHSLTFRFLGAWERTVKKETASCLDATRGAYPDPGIVSE